MEPNQQHEYARRYEQVVTKAWTDEAFKARLLADAAAVLQEEGIAVPAGVELRVVESTDKVMYISLPPKPSEILTDEQLDQVAGGTGIYLPPELRNPAGSWLYNPFSHYSGYP